MPELENWQGYVNEKDGKMLHIIKKSNKFKAYKNKYNFYGITLVKTIILNIHKDIIKWIFSCTTEITEI